MASGSVMASINSLVVQGETLVWHTGLPSEGEPRTSPPFSYGGREWCLRFWHRDEDGDYHTIRLHRLDAEGKIEEEGEVLTHPFRVHVHMQHLTEGDKVVGDVEDSNVCTTSEWLWLSGMNSEAIFDQLDWLRDRPEVKFACNFPTPPTIISTDEPAQKEEDLAKSSQSSDIKDEPVPGDDAETEESQSLVKEDEPVHRDDAETEEIQSLVKEEEDRVMKELESLKDDINNLQRTVQEHGLESENFRRTAGEYRCRLEDKMTVLNSRFEKAAFGGEAAEENNMDGEKGESGNGKKVKQQSPVKSTPKISLPVRHDDVICSLKSVLASGSRSDFTLKSGGGKKLAVHRAVLEGRSGHLDALLRGAEIRLDDVTDDAMDGLVRFLYAGEVGRSGNVDEILAVAHELNLEDLESLCVDCLGEWMCPELVCAALVAARVRDEGDLRARALDCYFRERSRVHATEGWKDLKENHPDIVAGLFQEFVTRFGKDNKMSLCAERDSISS